MTFHLLLKITTDVVKDLGQMEEIKMFIDKKKFSIIEMCLFPF